jgi:hypothetical protein
MRVSLLSCLNLYPGVKLHTVSKDRARTWICSKTNTFNDIEASITSLSTRQSCAGGMSLRTRRLKKLSSPTDVTVGLRVKLSTRACRNARARLPTQSISRIHRFLLLPYGFLPQRSFLHLYPRASTAPGAVQQTRPPQRLPPDFPSDFSSRTLRITFAFRCIHCVCSR